MKILRTLSILGVCFSGLVAGASEQGGNSEQERINELLSGVKTKAELNRFTNQRFTRCIAVSTSSEMCSWWLGNRSPAWKPLAEAVSTGKKINVLCVFPLDGSPREPASCSVHRPFVSEHEKDRQRRDVKLKRKWRDEGQALLDAARTLVELSRMIGEVPSECNAVSEDPRVCLWRTKRDTPGYKIVGRILGTSKKVRMTCRLPADGSPRADDSCSLEIGA